MECERRSLANMHTEAASADIHALFPEKMIVSMIKSGIITPGPGKLLLRYKVHTLNAITTAAYDNWRYDEVFCQFVFCAAGTNTQR